MNDFCGSEFWDLDLVWNTDNPQFTTCFEQTALIWIPCLFLLIFTPLELYYIKISKYANIPWSFLSISRLLISIILIGLSVSDLVYGIISKGSPGVYNVHIITPIIKMVTFTFATVLSLMHRKSGIMSSGILVIFWLFLLILAIPQFRSEIISHSFETDSNKIDEIWKTYKFIIYMIYFPLILLQSLCYCFADKPPKESFYSAFNKKSQNKPCPEVQSSFLSKIFFTWFDSMAWFGYRHPITTDDVYDLNPEDRTIELLPTFDYYWKKSVENGQKKRAKRQKGDKKLEASKKTNGSILPALIKTFYAPFILGGISKIVVDLIGFTLPFLLRELMKFTANKDAPIWQAYFFMVIMFVVSVLTALLNGQFLHKSFLVGIRIKTVLITKMYRKSLIISSAAKQNATIGEIVNLMAVDAQRFFETIQYLHLLWAGPLVIILAIYFLWQILGVAVLAGLAAMLFLLPFNAFVVSKLRSFQMVQMKIKDDRVKKMNELLNGIRVIKLYAWEPSFNGFIQDIREEELQYIKKVAFLNALTFTGWAITPFLVTVLSYVTYVLTLDENQVFDASTAFVSFTLFNILRMPLLLLPVAVANATQCSVAITRINKFLNSEELNDSNVTHKENAEGNVITVEKGSFSWGDENGTFLQNINLSVEKNSLVAIVGVVGSGKSTLIASLLGETEKMSGMVNTYGQIAYVAQQAWMLNATLKENILFGKPFEKEFYNQVIEACALLPDIKIFPAGDETEIGEKGINLSGGQKQRVSLARAVYSLAETYLLDDPLSAVDSHVGKHIFDKVIGPSGMLKEKTRLLVTHGISYLPQVKNIYVMNYGVITESGSYNKLMQAKGAFSSFIEQHLQEQDEDGYENGNGLGDNKALLSDRSLGKTVKRNSATQSNETVQQAINSSGKLMVKEVSRTGAVALEVYLKYFKSVGLFYTMAALINTIATQAFSVYSSIWLTEWATDNENYIPYKRDVYLSVYSASGILQGIFQFVAAMAIAVGGLNAARDIHNNLLKQTLSLPMSFFDTTPLGRIVNRFAKDMDTVDAIIPILMRAAITTFITTLSILVVICYSTPIFLTAIIPLCIVYYFIQIVYIASSRQLKRIESVTRSPIYSHFGETITGQSTIRAYNSQIRFIEEADNRIDHNQKCTYPSMCANRWVGVRLELIGSIVILFSILFAILARNTIDPGTVGLSISYAMQITFLLNFLIRMMADVETNIVAAERLEEYNGLEKEAEWITKPVDPNWPAEGRIDFKNYQLRYRENLDLVLKGISFTVQPAEKVGVVGRTGAGKSSLTLALFRIIEAAGGSILIDGIDISDMGLHSLRSQLTIIPQDPVLFSGTIRVNVDPLRAHSDDVIWTVLEHSHLKYFVENLPNGLDSLVSVGGENVSVGQRQLICLARALLRKTKILVLDEATAAVDLETDDLIQKTIRSQFEDCTVLTIAHRINTILDSDRVLVLDNGIIAEFDSPKSLLDDKRSVFYGMARDAGIA